MKIEGADREWAQRDPLKGGNMFDPLVLMNWQQGNYENPLLKTFRVFPIMHPPLPLLAVSEQIKGAVARRAPAAIDTRNWAAPPIGPQGGIHRWG